MTMNNYILLKFKGTDAIYNISVLTYCLMIINKPCNLDEEINLFIKDYHSFMHYITHATDIETINWEYIYTRHYQVPVFKESDVLDVWNLVNSSINNKFCPVLYCTNLPFETKLTCYDVINGYNYHESESFIDPYKYCVKCFTVVNY